MEDRYQVLLEAVEAERKFEEDFFSKSLSSKSVKEKVSLGFAWHPVKLLSSHYTIGENIELEFEKLLDHNAQHKIREGAGVRVVASKNNEELAYNGTVSFLKKGRMRVLLKGDAINKHDIPVNSYFTIEMVYDERPYRLMKNALKEVMNAKGGALKALREGIREKSFFDHQSNYPGNYENKNLNASQSQAINDALLADRFAIIHGPPGTGKTTTLTQLIVELSKYEKKILVCAPSNNATDLLSQLLDVQGIKVIRVGNVTRIGDDISHLTIDEKARNHKEWSRIKKIKIEAEEAKKMAMNMKRTYDRNVREERNDMFKESRDLLNWARTLEQRIISDILDETQVILTTLVGSASAMLDGLMFKTLIIDEASQLIEPEFWVAALKTEKVILAGDHKQLPPTVKSKEAMSLGLAETVLDRMTDVIKYSSLLNVQYRMNENILQFPNENFYLGKLRSADAVKNRYLNNDSKPVTFIDTAGTDFEEKVNPEFQSYYNEGEFFIIREHILQNFENFVGYEIGIITPYAEQVRYISSMISDDEQLRTLGMEVDSIDGFQGQEKDIIYISLVRSNAQSQIGFLQDERRLNVALTRAKKKLIIIGDSATLGNNVLYSGLLAHIDNKENYISAWEYMG